MFFPITEVLSTVSWKLRKSHNTRKSAALCNHTGSWHDPPTTFTRPFHTGCDASYVANRKLAKLSLASVLISVRLFRQDATLCNRCVLRRLYSFLNSRLRDFSRLSLPLRMLTGVLEEFA